MMHNNQRRKVQRIYMLASPEMEFPGDPTIIEAYANNISYGGLGFYSREPVGVVRDVSIRLRYPRASRLQEVEAITGQIRWCRPLGF